MQETGDVSSRTVRPGFCQVCARFPLCEAERLGITTCVEKLIPCRQGDCIYRAGAPYGGAYAVQSGMAKTVGLDLHGHEQVLAFHLPGEVFGLDAQNQHEYANAAIALGRTWFCRFPNTALERFGEDQPQVDAQLRQAAQRLRQRYRLRGNTEGQAEQRLASFLIDLQERRRYQGLRLDRLPLPMSRLDIASYLGMATETVSRSLSRLQKRAFIELVNTSSLRLLDETRLRQLAEAGGS